MKLDFENGYLKKPLFEDMKYTKRLWEDEATMAFNQKWGGTVAFPQSQWESFFNQYCSNNPHYLYFHIYSQHDEFVGEVSVKTKDLLTYSLNIKVLAEHRGNRYGFYALQEFVRYLFSSTDAIRIIDDVASDNQGAIGLLQKCGFAIKNQNKEITYMELDKNMFYRYNK